MSAQVLVVSNRKGGVGKSTTSVNLAAHWAALGLRVLLLDLDTQGHCAVGLGLKNIPPKQTIHHILAGNNADLTTAIIQTGRERLWLAPADPMFEHSLIVSDDKLRTLKNLLSTDAVQEQYDFIILDTPPSLDFLLLNALSAANWALIPFLPHALAAEGVRQLSRILFKVAMQQNANLRLVGLLPVMLDSRIGLHRTICDEMAKQFGSQRLLAGIRNDIKLAEAFACGKPVLEHAPASRGNADYRQLAEQLLLLFEAQGRGR